MTDFELALQLDAKANALLERYRLGQIDGSGDVHFPAAFGALDREFGSRGELERREVIEMWLDGGLAKTLDHRYHLLVVYDGDTLAAVRDCHTTCADGIAVAYLAHALVLPPFRRRGLGGLLRSAPLALARNAAPDSEVLLAAEMEFANPADRDSLIRLVAYGRAGFRAIDPRALPYFQPAFRPTDPPLPLLAVVGTADGLGDTLDKRRAAAYVHHLYTVFGTHCHDLSPRQRTEAALAAWPGDTVPLLPLPQGPDDPALEALR